MKLLFRVNASQKEGTGHLYECLWAAREMDAESVFCVNRDPVAAKLVREFGFRAETGEVNDVIARVRPDVVIVDLVDVRQSYLRRLKLAGAKLMVMNALRHPVSADLQVATVFVPHPKNKQHFGTQYILMKPVLQRLFGKPTAKTVKSVAILFGGGDPGGFTQKALSSLAEIPGNFRVNVIVGAANEHFSAIRSLVKNFPKACKLFRHITDEKKLASLLRGADLAFASGGYTLAELLHFGVPTIGMAQNDVEQEHVFPLFPKGSFINLGPGSKVGKKKLLWTVKDLFPYSRRAAISKKARRAVDGQGIPKFERLIQILAKPRVVVLGSSGNLGRMLVPVLTKSFEVSAPQTDITDRLALREVIRRGDVILNLVGASTDNKNPAAHFRINVAAQKILLDECKQAGIAKIIFPSSLNVYKFFGRPSRESDPVGATDDYTRTKLAAERLYKKYAKHFAVTILRLGSIYGPGLSKGIIPKFAETVKQSGSISIPRAEVFRDMLYIDDFRDLAARALRCPHRGFLLINGASGRKISFKKMAGIVQSSIARRPRVRYNEDRPVSTWGSPALARKVLGFVARTKPETGIKRTIKTLI